MLDISLPQTCCPGITGTIHTLPVAVAFPHSCTLKTREDSYWPSQFSFVKEKTSLGTYLELQSNRHSNQSKLLQKLLSQSFLKFFLIFFNLNNNLLESRLIKNTPKTWLKKGFRLFLLIIFIMLIIHESKRCSESVS